MPPTVKYVPLREMINHLLSGAGLGIFLALSLIVANRTILGMIVHSPHPKLSVLTFVAVVACLIAVGSAISGFVMSALDRR